MTLARFEFLSPRSLDEAVDLLAQKGPDAFVMAGGTDLLVKWQHQLIHPRTIISLKNIVGLNRISFGPRKGLFIGAAALLAEVAANKTIRRVYPAVAAAAANTANVQIRNMGTVVGNLCNASPAADNAPVLLAMKAELRIVSPDGTRDLPLENFFVGPGVTALQPAEIVASICVPTPPPGSGAAYLHLSARGRVDCSAASVGIFITLKGARVTEARIFIGACGPTPLSMHAAADHLKGKTVTATIAADAGRLAAGESKPISDVRANQAYRSQMVAVLVKRAILEAYRLARN